MRLVRDNRFGKSREAGTIDGGEQAGGRQHVWQAPVHGRREERMAEPDERKGNDGEIREHA